MHGQREQCFEDLERRNRELLENLLRNNTKTIALAEALVDSERRISDLTRTVGILRQELEQARTRGEELASEAKTARELRERVDLLHTSTSWRVTAPLRAAMQALLKMKSLIAGKSKMSDYMLSAPAKEPCRLIDSDTASVLWDAPPEKNHPHSAIPGSARERVLILEHRVPTPDRNSSSQRLWEMVKAISSLGKSMTFASHYAPSDYRWLLKDVDEELRPYVSALRGLGVKTIFGHTEIVHHLQQYGSHYRHVILSYPEIMYQYLPIVRAYAPQAHAVYDTVDLHGLRLEREARVKGGRELQERARHYKKMEKVNLLSADSVVAITEDERQAILQLAPDAKVFVVPNIHVVSEEPNVPPKERAGLLFIGHYLHNPNVDAVVYFVRDILPLVRQRIPGVKFFMVGSSMTEEVRALAAKNIEAIGYVPDPAPYFRQCRVFVAPLRFGAGMKGKIGQSIGFGLPVVTSSVGAEGMGLVDGESVMIAETAAQFAEAVVRLYTDDDLWMTIAQEARNVMERSFSPQVVQRQIAELLASAHDRRDAGSSVWAGGGR